MFPLDAKSASVLLLRGRTRLAVFFEPTGLSHAENALCAAGLGFRVCSGFQGLPRERAVLPTCLFFFRPQIGRDYPLNLSISLSGGRETNQDSPSSGERSGKSPSPNPRGARAPRGNCGVRKSGPEAAAAPRSF